MQDQGLHAGEGGAEKVTEKTGALQKGAGNLAHAGKPVNRSLFFRQRRKRLRIRDLQGSSRMTVPGEFFLGFAMMEIQMKKEVHHSGFSDKSSLPTANREASRGAFERVTGSVFPPREGPNFLLGD
jgi:hypothetical protein